MFFKFDIHQKSGKRLYFTKQTDIFMQNATYSDFIISMLRGSVKDYSKDNSSFIREINFSLGYPKKVRSLISRHASFLPNDESYAIVIGETTQIYSDTERGFIYAAATLSQLYEFGELESGFVYDVPIGTERGYRVFLPSRAEFEDFYRMVDLLAYYKFNSIIIEIGGAMEYKRHPKINEAWREFCRETRRYSGRAREIQHFMYEWHKNSIHCDNAGGDILTQEECRSLAEYCRSRGLQVIPECPSLSHCDFLVMAYPDIREREGDAYPDTYCPNHPETYKYVFDILEEVIDVFEPSAINIGHDETYSIGVCPRCASTPAYVLYSEDVKKIHSFLTKKNIKTYMWGEKLLKAFDNRKTPIGGSGHGKGLAKVPALYPCRDLLPKDITFLHWYWCFNPKYDKIYHERGMRVLYGNLHPLNVEKWNKRRSMGINGGYVSNWGAFGEEYMQRNCQYIALVSAAYAFWCDDFEARGAEELVGVCMSECYRLKCKKISNPIKIVHSTDYDIPYVPFYDGLFIEDEKYLIGNYHLKYSDGSIAALPVRYGTHVGCNNYKNAYSHNGFRQLSYGTLPIKIGSNYVFEAVYENPYPNKSLISVSYAPMEGKEDIRVDFIGFYVEKGISSDNSAKTNNESSVEDIVGIQV